MDLCVILSLWPNGYDQLFFSIISGKTTKLHRKRFHSTLTAVRSGIHRQTLESRFNVAQNQDVKLESRSEAILVGFRVRENLPLPFRFFKEVLNRFRSFCLSYSTLFLIIRVFKHLMICSFFTTGFYKDRGSI